MRTVAEPITPTVESVDRALRLLQELAQHGSGATLTRSGSAYTLTTEDGTVIVYDYTVVATAEPNRGARATSITSPTGDRIALTWVSATWCTTPQIEPCPESNLRTKVRLQSISDNLGHQLHFQYGNSLIFNATTAASWQRLDRIDRLDRRRAGNDGDPLAHLIQAQKLLLAARLPSS